MSRIKEQAIEILQDIPDEKVGLVVEILKELRSLYAQAGEAATHGAPQPAAMGIFRKYANADLVPMEKEAWGEAVKEKHASD